MVPQRDDDLLRAAQAMGFNPDALAFTAVLEALDEVPRSRSELLERAGVHDVHWRLVIDALVGLGAAIRTGRKRGTRYTSSVDRAVPPTGDHKSSAGGPGPSEAPSRRTTSLPDAAPSVVKASYHDVVDELLADMFLGGDKD